MLHNDRPDAVLWLEATTGTPAAFGVVYDRHRMRILRKARSLVTTAADAEDVVAIVFLEAWRRRDSVRLVDGSLLPWLLVVTSNVTRNVERSGRRHRRLLAKLPPSTTTVDPAEAAGERIDGERTAMLVDSALGRLTTSERRIVDLCLVEELPMATVASVLDLPVGTVKSRLHRARRKLQHDLRRPEAGFGLTGGSIAVEEVPG